MKKRQSIKYNNFIVHRLVLGALLCAVACVVRFALAPIPGIELVTFIVCLLALILPFVDGLLVVIAMLIITSLVLNFGPWYFAYIFIFPVDFLLTKLVKKLIKNKYIFATWCGILALYVTGAYFVMDWIFVSYTYAVADLFTAIPFAILGFVSNFVIALLVTEPLIKAFNINAKKFYGDAFNKIKLRTFNKFWTIAITASMALTGVAGAVVCYMNAWKFEFLSQQFFAGNNYHYRDGLLTNDDYNKLQASLHDDQFAVVAIYGGLTFTAVVTGEGNTKLTNVITNDSYLNSPDTFVFNTKQELTGNFITEFTVDYKGDKFHWDHKVTYGKDHECAFIYDSTFTSGADLVMTQCKHIYQLSFDVKNEYGRYCSY